MRYEIAMHPLEANLATKEFVKNFVCHCSGLYSKNGLNSCWKADAPWQNLDAALKGHFFVPDYESNRVWKTQGSDIEDSFRVLWPPQSRRVFRVWAPQGATMAGHRLFGRPQLRKWIILLSIFFFLARVKLLFIGQFVPQIWAKVIIMGQRTSG